MKKTFILFLTIALFTSCKKDEPNQNDDSKDLPIASTLKLSKDYNPLAAYQTIVFTYTDINGNQQFIHNPEDNQVTDVDFTQYVKVTAVAGNNLDPDVLCNWNLKKDGVVIEVQNVQNFLYENQ